MQSTLIQRILASKQVDSRFIDDQNLISKLSLLELLQKYEKYLCLDSSYNTTYYKRIETSLRFIPAKFQRAALTLFANVFYVGESVLSDALVYLFKEVVAYFGNDQDKLVQSMHVFEVDPSGLIEAFFRVNNIEGRLDSNTFSRCKSVSELITSLDNFNKCIQLQNNEALTTSIKILLQKDIWVLLSDFSFSGTSITSDIKRLIELREICFPSRKQPSIVLCVQIISFNALITIEEAFHGQVKVFYAQCYDDTYRVLPKSIRNTLCDASSGNCILFEKDQKVYSSVVKLCEWFGKEYIDRDPAHESTKSKTDRKTMAFGFKDCGYTIIPQRNAPSNSLPILWYKPSKAFIDAYKMDYIPPFPRTISRISQSNSGDGQNLKDIRNNKRQLQSLLKKIMNQRIQH